MSHTFTGNNSPKSTSLENKKSKKSFKLFIIISIVGSLLLVTSNAATAISSKADPLATAQAALDKANKEANTAAGKYQEANSNLQKLNDKVAEVTGQLTQTEASLAQVKDKVAQRAISSYIDSSDKSASDPYKDAIDKTRRAQLLDTVAEVDDNQISEFVGLKEDLQVQQDQLAALQDDAKTTLSALAAQKKELDAKLAAASKAKKDIETKIANDKKAAAAAQAAAAKKAKVAANTKSSTASGTVINPGNQNMVCPISGSLAYTNDWGQTRSGGRTHKGIDLFSPRGTPNVAIVAGRLYFQNSGLGGLSAIIESPNGYSYYYTHLNDTVGAPRQVVAGEVIAHTGSSGNASANATHTHFEIWGAGYAKLPPYATINSIC